MTRRVRISSTTRLVSWLLLPTYLTIYILTNCENVTEPDFVLYANHSTKIIEGIEYSLSINKEYYGLGEPVIIKYGVTNLCNKTQKLSVSPFFPTILPHVYLVYTDTTDNIVWGKTSFAVPDIVLPPVYVSLKQGKTLVDSIVWNQKDNDSVFVASGSYRIESFSHTFNKGHDTGLECYIYVQQ